MVGKVPHDGVKVNLVASRLETQNVLPTTKSNLASLGETHLINVDLPCTTGQLGITGYVEGAFAVSMGSSVIQLNKGCGIGNFRYYNGFETLFGALPEQALLAAIMTMNINSLSDAQSKLKNWPNLKDLAVRLGKNFANVLYVPPSRDPGSVAGGLLKSLSSRKWIVLDETNSNLPITIPSTNAQQLPQSLLDWAKDSIQHKWLFSEQTIAQKEDPRATVPLSGSGSLLVLPDTLYTEIDCAKAKSTSQYVGNCMRPVNNSVY